MASKPDAQIARERADSLEEALGMFGKDGVDALLGSGDDWTTAQEVAFLRRLAAQSERLEKVEPALRELFAACEVEKARRGDWNHVVRLLKALVRAKEVLGE